MRKLRLISAPPAPRLELEPSAACHHYLRYRFESQRIALQNNYNNRCRLVLIYYRIRIYYRKTVARGRRCTGARARRSDWPAGRTTRLTGRRVS